MTPNELEPQFDEASNPHCTYSIRKGAVDGPEVHAAVVGETVFHVWQCNNANVGILVQNCHVEESNVFKFVDKSMTRFRCQLRLCVKNRGHGCDAITPPNTCSMVDDDSNVMALSTSTSSSLLAADDVDQPKRSPISRPASPSASSGPPATNNVSPPSTVGRHGVSVEPVNGARPPSMIVNSGSGMPTQQVPNTNTKTIGPPSIRPFGLSTAHIVSGKTNGKDNGAAAAMMSSRRNAAVVAQSPATSNQPASPPGSHQSGYSLRSRRSIMIYGNGSRSLEDGPTPPNAPFNYYNRLQKRHSNSSNSVDLAYNATTTPTTTQHENRKKQLPDLDVVGLIRVLDNPEDLEFYEEKKKSGSNSHKVYVTAETRRYPTSTNELKDSATQVVPLDESAEQTAAELGEKARLIVDTEELDSEKESQRCISPTLYWMLISTLGLLASIQLVGIALFLADRLIFDKTIAKRVNKLLHH
uniref:ZP domain-containing protein n=1 Tax=Ditylenchus dipsaci TaxID=166011 RepID=A0A915DJT4_9BILA